MRVRHWLYLLVLSGIVHASHPARAAQERDPTPAAAGADDSPETIVVTGHRYPGAVLGGVPPEIELDPQDIASFGAGRVAELLDQLAPQIQGAGEGAGRPLVLVNGQRISGFSEIRDLPPEAILRVDILPEEVARRYGYRAGQKVVNLVLRPSFHAITVETEHGFASEGGRPTHELNLDVSRISTIGRWSLHAEYQHVDSLLESERDIVEGSGRFRDLLPQTDRFSLSGSFTRDISPSVSLAVNAQFDAGRTRGRMGSPFASVEPLSFDLRSLRPLTRESRSRTMSAGAALNGTLAEWHWSFAANYGRSRIVTGTDVPRAPDEPGTARDRVRSLDRTLDAQLFAYGTLASMPAGDLTGSFSARVDRHDYHSRSLTAGVRREVALTRTSGNLEGSFDIPIVSDGSRGLGRIGDLSADFNLGVTDVSDFGSLRSFGYGVRWSPIERIAVTASVTNDEAAPDVQQLGDPLILTPNVRVFDFVTGKTFDVTRLSGGNRKLIANERRRIKAGVTVRPLSDENLSLAATYVSSRTRNPVAYLSTPTPEIEAAFPERFTRASDGTLLRIDARPLNFARAHSEELRWGINWFKTIFESEHTPRPPAREAPESVHASDFDLKDLVGTRTERGGRLQLSLYHTWRLRDEMLIRDGVPKLDFLRGSAAGFRGGRPRHEIEAQAGLYRTGFGLRVSARWQSGTTVRSAPGDGAGRLVYSDLAKLDLHLFADLGEQRALVRAVPWLRGARLSLAIDNVFNSRPKVRDETGATPRGLQPAYLDPLGRSVSLTFRKLL